MANIRRLEAKEGNLSSAHGSMTRQIGQKLEAALRLHRERYPRIELFYDHGLRGNLAVCAPTAYMGRRQGPDAKLSELDIVLLHRGSVFLLIEIEESQARPKTVLGDVFGVVLSDRVSIRGHPHPHPIKNATLIVAVTVSERGRRAAKYARLERLLKRHITALQRAVPRTKVTKIRMVTSSRDDLVRRIERLIRSEVGKGVAKR